MKKTALFILLLAGGIGGFFAWREYEKRTGAKEPTHLTLYGNVEIRRVHLGFRVAGRIESICCDEGDTIATGAVIATLDKRPCEENLAAALAKTQQTQSQLERLENGSRPQEIEQARAALEECKATLLLTEEELKRSDTLVKTNAVSVSEFDTAKSRRDIAIARVKQAEETLALLIEGPRKEDIAAAKALLTEAQANRSKAETALADTELLSPNDGILLTRIEEVGAVVAAGQTIVTLSLKDALWVYVYISETELGKITPGQKVEISTDSTEKIYFGHIGYISPEAEFTPKNVETPKLRTDLVYRVRIIVDPNETQLRQGMPVTVRVY